MAPRLKALLFLCAAWVLSPLASAQDGGGAGATPDFRVYIFGAYSAVFVLLFGFVAVLFGRQKALDREVDILKERLARKEARGETG